LVSSITSQTFGGCLLVPGTQLNKQQSTTAKVSVGQRWKASGRRPTWGGLVGRVDVGAKWLVGYRSWSKVLCTVRWRSNRRGNV